MKGPRNYIKLVTQICTNNWICRLWLTTKA